MTEEKAGSKRCCGPEGTGHEDDGKRWCIASDCMAWRWNWDLKKTDIRDPEDRHLPSGGYCGLAGKP